MGAGKENIKTELLIKAISDAENKTSGEIRIHLSKKKLNHSILEEARSVFSKLEMHKTRDRNAVLLLVDLNGHQFSLYGDQGIHDRVTQTFWTELCLQVEEKIKNTSLTDGLVLAVHAIGDALKLHFPSRLNDNPDELSNAVTEE